jgi:hypothetical protein
MQVPTNFSESFIIIDDFFTKKDLSIAKSYLWFFKERLMETHTHTNPSIQTIARMSSCCTRTVDRFIKKYNDILFVRENDSVKKGIYVSSEYTLNPDFFEWFMILDYCGYIKKWNKKVAIEVLKRTMEDEWFLLKILYKKKVINTEMSHAWMRKCRTIKFFLLQIHSTYKVLQGAGSMNKSKEGAAAAPTDRRGSGKEGRVLEGLPLSQDEKNKLHSLFGYMPLKEARENFLFVNGDNGNVKNAASFIFIKAKNKMNKIFERK